MANETADIISDKIIAALDRAERHSSPYRHWTLENILTQEAVDQVIELPWAAQDVGDDSGRREIHNDTRNYFSREHRLEHAICQQISLAFQNRDTISAIQKVTGQSFASKYFRIEYTQDKGNFWLEPHTDIGAKKFTMLIYLSKNDNHDVLGTDLYEECELESSDEMGYKHVGQAEFKSNNAVMFIPGDDTWHGFEPKWIDGVRKALIINYVDAEWRDRDQLCFPDVGQI